MMFGKSKLSIVIKNPFFKVILTSSILLISNKVFAASLFVSSQNELVNALKVAKSGDEIILKSGATFSEIKMYKPKQIFSQGLAIRSEDAKNPAIVGTIGMTSTANIKVSHIIVSNNARYVSVSISDCKNITISDSVITANLDLFDPNQSTRGGISIRGLSDGISIENNLITRVTTGIGISTSRNVLIRNNLLQENILDNINVGSNVSNLVIEKNTMYAQRAALFPDHHYDNIQLWVQTDATEDSENIQIIDNSIFDLGDSIHPQAIFARGDYKNADGAYNKFKFKNVEVARNLVVTQHSNAIAFTDVENLSIHNNTLVYGGKYGKSPDAVSVPTIRSSLSEKVVVYDNILPGRYGLPTTDTNEFFGNILYGVNTGEISDTLLNPYSKKPVREDFHTIPLSTYKGVSSAFKGIYSLETSADNIIPQFFHSLEVKNNALSYVLDASISVFGAKIKKQDLKYDWIFSDGSKAQGQKVSKNFGDLDEIEVTLKISYAQSRVFQASKVLKLKSAHILKLEFNGDIVDETNFESSLVKPVNPIFNTKKTSIRVGDAAGHLYLSPLDPDLHTAMNAKALNIKMSFMPENNNSRKLVLIASHGFWSLHADVKNDVLQLSYAGKRISSKKKLNLANNSIHKLSLTIVRNSLKILLDEQDIFEVTLSDDEVALLLNPKSSYGLSFGGSGPWLKDPQGVIVDTFLIDNLYMGLSEGGEFIKELDSLVSFDFERELENKSGNSEKATSTGVLSFVADKAQGKALAVGDNYGHLYWAQSAAASQQLKSADSLAIKMKFKAHKLQTALSYILFSKHGKFGLSVHGIYEKLRLGIGGKTYTATPTFKILDDAWHTCEFSYSKSSFQLKIDDVVVIENNQLSQAEVDALLGNNAWGLGFGGSGPWKASNRPIFLVDDVVVK